MNRWKLFHALGAAALLFAAAPAALAHGGEHDEASHGGVMVPHGAMHFEVVAKPKGGVDVYFSDEHGNPLPASAASQLAVEIEHPKSETEYLAMAIDRTGGFWTGSSKPLTDGGSVLHIGFVMQGKPALVDVPGASLIAAAKNAGHHGH